MYAALRSIMDLKEIPVGDASTMDLSGMDASDSDATVVDVRHVVFPKGSITTAEAVAEEFNGRATTDFKEELAQLCVETICPIGDEMKRLLEDR